MAKRLRRKAKLLATLVYVDEPQLLLLESGKTKVIAAAISKLGMEYPFLATVVTNEEWQKYLRGVVDLRYLFVYARLRKMYEFDLSEIDNDFIYLNLRGMDDDRFRDVLKGRLALALVSARARQCSRRECGRRRRCLGRMVTSFHAPLGDCPNMSAAEWRLVSLGMQRNIMRLKPTMDARAAAKWRETGLDRRSWAEQCRRWNAPEAVRERQEAEWRQAQNPGALYRDVLWWNPADGGLTLPLDFPGTQRQFVATLAAHGCSCARRTEMGECGGCPGLGEERRAEGSRGVGE